MIGLQPNSSFVEGLDSEWTLCQVHPVLSCSACIQVITAGVQIDKTCPRIPYFVLLLLQLQFTPAPSFFLVKMYHDLEIGAQQWAYQILKEKMKKMFFRV